MSIKPCSVVPGLPKMWRTPSAISCSSKARLPVVRTIGTFVAQSVRPGQAQHPLGQIVQHHLLGDRCDAEQADLAPQPLDVELARVAEAAEGLQRGVAGAEAGVAA